MAELAVNKTETALKKGMQAGISIAIGYVPVALTFGLLAKTTGLTFSETVLMSSFVYAGASQYMALSLLALGTGVLEIILTTFIVNIRHFLMAAALNEKAEEDRLLHKMFYSFGITDETFSVAAIREGKLRTGFIYGLNIIAYLSWVIFSGFGYLLGAGLPQTLQESMSIALYAMFIGLLVPSMKKGTKVIFLATLAACFNSIFTLTEVLSKGWSIVAATLISAVTVELIGAARKKAGGGGDE